MSEIIKKFEVFNELKDEFLNEIKLLYVFGDAINKNNVLIVTHDDKVFAFGDNKWGVLGFGNNRKVNELTFNEELSHKQIIDFKNDDKHVIARTIDGKVYCWGFYGLFSDLGNEKNGRKINKPQLNMYLRDEKIVDISCGSDHTIVLTNCGEVYAWGWNDWGQVGNVKIDYFEYQAKPIKVNGFDGEKVIMISCGCSHSMALTESGRVFSWGENEFGQLGLNSTDDANEPLILLLSNEIPIKKISCGSNHSLLLSRDGDIYWFGYNGIETQITPKKLTIGENKFIDIASHHNYDFSIALSMNCIYYIWGDCKRGHLKEPIETQFKSFDEIFANFYVITHKTLKFNKNEFQN